MRSWPVFLGRQGNKSLLFLLEFGQRRWRGPKWLMAHRPPCHLTRLRYAGVAIRNDLTNFQKARQSAISKCVSRHKQKWKYILCARLYDSCEALRHRDLHFCCVDRHKLLLPTYISGSNFVGPILWTIPTYRRYAKPNGGVWAMSPFRALSPSLQKLKKPSANRTVAGCRDRGHCLLWVWGVAARFRGWFGGHG